MVSKNNNKYLKTSITQEELNDNMLKIITQIRYFIYMFSHVFFMAVIVYISLYYPSLLNLLFAIVGIIYLYWHTLNIGRKSDFKSNLKITQKFLYSISMLIIIYLIVNKFILIFLKNGSYEMFIAKEVKDKIILLVIL